MTKNNSSDQDLNSNDNLKGTTEDDAGNTNKSSPRFNPIKKILLGVGVFSLLVAISIVCFLLFTYFTFKAEQSMVIHNDMSTPITIKKIIIDGRPFESTRMPRLLDTFPSGAPYPHDGRYIFNFKSSQVKKLELIINDPAISDKDFLKVCNIPHEQRETCIFLVWYKKDSSLSCYCDSDYY